MPTQSRLLVPDDALLRNPPANLDASQKVALDGIRFALDMANLSFERLHEDLMAVSRAFETGQRDITAATSAFADAWTIVDNLWRLNRVIRRMRGLSRSPELEVQLRALAEVEEFRHGVQHIDERFAECVASDRPLWGSLSWYWTPEPTSGRGLGFVMVSGAFRGGAYNVLPNPNNRTYSTPIGIVMLSAFGRELELTTYVERIRHIGIGLETGLRQAVAALPQGATAGGTDFIMAGVYAPSSGCAKPAPAQE